MLRHYGVKPILVFDGGLLPIKSDQETKRARYVLLWVRKSQQVSTAKEHLHYSYTILNVVDTYAYGYVHLGFQPVKFICNFTSKLWIC
jgi:hypothetical protein